MLRSGESFDDDDEDPTKVNDDEDEAHVASLLEGRSLAWSAAPSASTSTITAASTTPNSVTTSATTVAPEELPYEDFQESPAEKLSLMIDDMLEMFPDSELPLDHAELLESEWWPLMSEDQRATALSLLDGFEPPAEPTIHWTRDTVTAALDDIGASRLHKDLKTLKDSPEYLVLAPKQKSRYTRLLKKYLSEQDARDDAAATLHSLAAKTPPAHSPPPSAPLPTPAGTPPQPPPTQSAFPPPPRPPPFQPLHSAGSSAPDSDNEYAQFNWSLLDYDRLLGGNIPMRTSPDPDRPRTRPAQLTADGPWVEIPLTQEQIDQEDAYYSVLSAEHARAAFESMLVDEIERERTLTATAQITTYFGEESILSQRSREAIELQLKQQRDIEIEQLRTDAVISQAPESATRGTPPSSGMFFAPCG